MSVNEKYSLEQMFEIWDNKAGEVIEVGLDRDGLGLIEIREKVGGKIQRRLALNTDQVKFLIIALQKLVPNSEV